MGMSTTDRARLAALVRHAHGDTKAATQPMRSAWRARFEREVDPEGVMPPEERAVRADRLLRAHMIRLAAKSAEVRRRREK